MTSAPADTSAELLARARAGDAEAFAALVERHRPAAFARLRRKISDPHDQADAWQETLVAAWQSLDALRDAARFGGWLAQIAAHKADGWHRRRYAQQRMLDVLGEPAAPTSPLAPSGEATARTTLAAAFRRLSRDHRRVILGHYHEGQTYEQLSASLQITPDLVRSRLQKARTRLKTEIETMTASTTATETLHLNPDDVASLLALAGACYRGPDNRPALRGVLLDPRTAQATATDGRHLATRRLPALSTLQAPLIVTGWEKAQGGRFSDGATLALGLAELILTDSSGEPFLLPIIEADFPNPAPLLQRTPPGTLTLSLNDLHAALADLAPYLADKHVAHDGWTYTPLLRLEWREDGLLLSTHEHLGLSPNSAPNSAAPSLPRWRHELAVPAHATGEVAPAFTLVNADLLASALRTLSPASPREITIGYEPVTPVIRLGHIAAPETCALIMPVKAA